MKGYSKIILLTFLMIPFAFGSEEITRGDFGAFVPSLMASSKSYSVIDGTHLKSPVKMIEKFELVNGSCSKNSTWDDCKTDRERVELKQKDESQITPNIHWYGWSFYLPSDFSNIWPVKLSIAQFFDDKNDSPSWMFQVNEQGLSVENFVSKKAGLTNLIKEKELRNKWHVIELEVLWSQNNTGLFNVWVNGQQKMNYKGPTIIKGPYFFKYGLYRSFLSRWKNEKPIPNQKIYFGNVKMGLTRKSLLH